MSIMAVIDCSECAVMIEPLSRPEKLILGAQGSLRRAKLTSLALYPCLII